MTFAQPSSFVKAYDFLEFAPNVVLPDARNPFTDATLTGWFAKSGQAERVPGEGFCDSADGSVFRMRFMPSRPGEYSYSLTYRQGDFVKSHSGSFRATGGGRRGPVRVDPKYAARFIHL